MARATSGQRVVVGVWVLALTALGALAAVLVVGGAATAEDRAAAPTGTSVGDDGFGLGSGASMLVDPAVGVPVGAVAAPSDARTLEEALAESADGELVVSSPLILDGVEPVLIDAPGLRATVRDGVLVDVEPGPGRMSLPAFGPMADAVAAGLTEGMLSGTIGYASGADLAHLGGHLRPDAMYWWLIVSDGAQIDSGIGLEEVVPVSFSLPGGGSSFVIVDPTDPYVYFGFPCPASAPDEQGDEQGGDDQSDTVELDISLSTYPGGGCGFGVSGSGRIPATQSVVAGIPAHVANLEAEVVIDGEFPVSYVGVVGSAYLDLRDGGVVLAADGEFSVAMPFDAGSIELSIPVGRASLALELTGDTLDLWFAGSTGTDLLRSGDGGFFDALLDVAPTQAELTIEGRLRLHDTGAAIVVATESYLQLSGAAEIGLARLAGASGVDLAPAAAANLLVRLDGTGLTADATMATSPIPGLDFGSDVTLAVAIPFADLSAGSAELAGSFHILDATIDGVARIDADGVLVRGILATPAGGIEVEGYYGPNGVQLTGTAEVSFTIPDLGALAEAVAVDAGVNETIRALEARMDERIAEIRQFDPARADRLATTVRDMRAARAEVAKIQDNIDINNGLIADLNQQLVQAGRDWDNYTELERIANAIPHGAYVTFIYGEIGTLELANTTQQTLMDGAQLGLTGLESLFLEIAGTDDQLRALQQTIIELRAETAIGNVIATVAGAADAVLDAFGIEGTISATAFVSAGTQGVVVDLAVTWCRDGRCDTLAGGSVQLPEWRACATVVGIEACAQL